MLDLGRAVRVIALLSMGACASHSAEVRGAGTPPTRMAQMAADPIVVLVEGYLNARHRITRLAPLVVICEPEGHNWERLLTAGEGREPGRIISGLVLDPRCELPPSRAEGALLLRQVVVGHDTTTIEAEFHQEVWPRRWREVFRRFPEPAPGDWTLTFFRFAGVD
jgi:hypothetical protein